MTIGQAIKQGVSVTQRSWALIGMFVGLSLLVTVAVAAALFFMASAGLLPSPDTALSGRQRAVMIAITLLGATMAGLISVYLNGGLLGYLKQQLRTGQARVAQFWAAGAQFFGRMLGQGVLITLIGLGVLIIGGLVYGVGLVAAGRMEQMSLAVAVPLALVASVPLAIGLYGFLLLSFAPVVLVFEDSGVVQALGRSVRFVRSRIGQLFVLTVIYMALSVSVSLVTELATRWVTTAVTVTALRVALALILGLLNMGLGIYLNLLAIATVIGFYAGASDASAPASTDIPAPS